MLSSAQTNFDEGWTGEENMTESTLTRRALNVGLAAGSITIFVRTARAAEFNFRQYHNQPVESPLHKRLTEMWARVNKETGGHVAVAIFPENNHFKEGDPDPLELVREGKLEFMTLSGNGIAGLVPAADIQATPFAFRNLRQVYAAMDGDLGAYLTREMMAKGIYMVPGGCFENGMHQITSANRQIHTAADMDGLKIRVPGSKLYRNFFETLGAEVHTMNINGMYGALKSGGVEAQDDPLDVVELFKLYEVQQYAAMTNHSWSGYNMLTNFKMWQGLPEAIRTIITANLRKAARLQRADTDSLNEGLHADLKKRGMIFVDNPDTESFRARLASFYPRWKAAVGTRAWDILTAHVGQLG
jgi:TRAP-type transport system periplasmic protein